MQLLRSSSIFFRGIEILIAYAEGRYALLHYRGYNQRHFDSFVWQVGGEVKYFSEECIGRDLPDSTLIFQNGGFLAGVEMWISFRKVV